eukprot:1314735-Amphidinium_carterae.2
MVTDTKLAVVPNACYARLRPNHPISGIEGDEDIATIVRQVRRILIDNERNCQTEIQKSFGDGNLGLVSNAMARSWTRVRWSRSRHQWLHFQRRCG